MKKLISPMMGAGDILRYRETHEGIPLKIRLWLYFSGLTAYFVIQTPFAIVFFLAPIPFNVIGFFGIGLNYMIRSIALSIPRLDFYIPLGFHMFKWTIEVRE